MQLALFDLDHTLIPFDSGMEWMRFLVECGVVDAADGEAYLAGCRQYLAGTLDIHALHRLAVSPIGRQPRSQRLLWAEQFEQRMATRIPSASRALVERHRAQGDLCAIVTATTRLIAEPFGRLYGVAHVLATEASESDDVLSGAIEGLPCHGEHKLAHVKRWLAGRKLALESFDRSWFYSDSAGDLPLLEAVTDPVAVRPDVRLRAHALGCGWIVIEGIEE